MRWFDLVIGVVILIILCIAAIREIKDASDERHMITTMLVFIAGALIIFFLFPNAAKAEMRLKNGASGKQVREIQELLQEQGYYPESSKITGRFGDTTEDAVGLFQLDSGLNSDGIVGDITYKVLTGQPIPQVEEIFTDPQMTSWWDVRNEIPINADFAILDCRSGRVFHARRWSGGNHLDAEPLAVLDRDIMLEIYGGEWSWDRRPVLVRYDGKTYAASMNGMPHGSEMNDNEGIWNNDFDGMFCIHFKGSKGHESNKRDAKHQACVEEAAKCVADITIGRPEPINRVGGFYR